MRRRIKEKYIIIPLVIILIVILFGYGTIISKKIKSKKFANNNIEAYEKNKEQVFKVEKIIICSSASATDLSEKQNLQDMSIYQYTDIAVYINNNGEELTNKNTVKKLYIDNISLEGTSDIGTKSLGYKNILKLGMKKEAVDKEIASANKNSEYNVFQSLISSSNENLVDVGNINVNSLNDAFSSENSAQNYETSEEENINENKTNNEPIDFNIVYTNEENEKADYDKPTFYTDCSNPITLEYINNDIITHYKMDENKSLSFDGKLLKEAGVSIESLACKIKFKINIVNNLNEKYSCPVSFKIPLSDIYDGTTLKAKTTNEKNYVFFRE